MNNYHNRFQKAIDFLKQQKGFSHLEMAKRFNSFKSQQPTSAQKIGLSASQISRYYKGKEVIKPVIAFVEGYLKTLGIIWSEEAEEYQLTDSGIDDLAILPIFKNLKGVYHVYHLSQYGNTILRNILRIDQTGKVIIDAYSNCKHHGQATVFKDGLVSIQLHTLEHAQGDKEDFCYHILANIAAYAQNGDIFHFVGISTTIPMSYEPTANKRVFIKVSNDDEINEEGWTHQLFFVDNEKEMEELNALPAGRVADFLLRTPNLIVKEKANELLS